MCSLILSAIRPRDCFISMRPRLGIAVAPAKSTKGIWIAASTNFKKSCIKPKVRNNLLIKFATSLFPDLRKLLIYRSHTRDSTHLVLLLKCCNKGRPNYGPGEEKLKC